MEQLIGRDGELRLLDAAWAAARAGRGRVVLITGEPGSGKTATAAWLAERTTAAGAGVVWAASPPRHDAPPMWPWAQVVRSVLRDAASGSAAITSGRAAALATLVPEVAQEFPDKPEGPSPESVFGVADALLGWLADVAEQRPLLIVIDDLGTADDATISLAEFFAREGRATPLLLVATAAEDETGDLPPLIARFVRDAMRVSLPPLTPEESTRLFEMIAKVPPPELSEGELHRITRGNPFFIAEVARYAASGGSLRRPDRSTGFHVPANLRDLLLARIDALPDDQASLLRAASVCGEEFAARLVADVTRKDVGSIEDELGSLVDQGILEEIGSLGRFRFRHVALRDALYASQPTSKRRRTHATIVRCLEKNVDKDEAVVGELADHLFKAGDAGDPPAAFAYAVRAATAAEAKRAARDAARHIHRALQLVPLVDVEERTIDELRKRLELLDAAATPTATSGEFPNAADCFVREGDLWLVAFHGRATRLRDAKGLRYLARLLAMPGKEVHTLDLVGGYERAVGEIPAGELETGDVRHPLLDEQAKRAYRRRIEDLRAEIAEAEEFHDLERRETAARELDQLVEALATAVGLGGRDRTASSASERARVASTRAIRAAIDRIREELPELGQHLDVAIKTGTYLSYQVDPAAAPPSWRIEP